MWSTCTPVCDYSMWATLTLITTCRGQIRDRAVYGYPLAVLSSTLLSIPSLSFLQRLHLSSCLHVATGPSTPPFSLSLSPQLSFLHVCCPPVFLLHLSVPSPYVHAGRLTCQHGWLGGCLLDCVVVQDTDFKCQVREVVVPSGSTEMLDFYFYYSF